MTIKYTQGENKIQKYATMMSNKKVHLMIHSFLPIFLHTVGIFM